ncbi:hypothetical protein evm_005890 [Chilo suppressalis]|nr:hypothetical protein evm_005890 [Chilo suppressalis]
MLRNCELLEEDASNEGQFRFEAEQSKSDDSKELSINQNNESENYDTTELSMIENNENEKDDSTELSMNQNNGRDEDGSMELPENQNNEREEDGAVETLIEYINDKGKVNKQIPQILDKEQYEIEKLAGDPTDTFGITQHHYYPTEFKDFGRRFVLQYPYVKKGQVDAELVLDKDMKKVKKQRYDKEDLKLLPVKAPPELVLSVALRSALDEVDQPQNFDVDEKNILRSGDYWDSVWKEDVDPKTVLRSFQDKTGYELENTFPNHTPKLNSLKAKIMPGSKLYQLVSVLKSASPRLVYVINNANKP